MKNVEPSNSYEPLDENRTTKYEDFEKKMFSDY